jgi:valyl-tRNA synthetase
MDPKINEKAWNPELEKEILKQWDEEKIYAFSPTLMKKHGIQS